MRGGLIISIFMCLALAIAAAAPAQSLTTEEKAELEQTLKNSDIINPEPDMSDGDSELRIVRRIPAPGVVVKGLAWQDTGGFLWVLIDTNPIRVVAIDEDGNQGNNLNFERNEYVFNSLTSDGSNLWTLDVSKGQILLIDIYHRRVDKDWKYDISNLAELPTGLAWEMDKDDNNFFWIADRKTRKIIKYDYVNKKFIKEFDAPNQKPGYDPYGLAIDGNGNVWCSDIKGIHKKASDNTFESYEYTEFQFGHAYALTYGGGYLWAGSILGNGIMQIDIGTEGLPKVTTKDADEKHDSATVSGTVNPEGKETDYYFEYGETTGFGKKTSLFDAGDGTENIEVEVELENLDKDTKYYFRIVAENSTGKAYGDTANFVTKEFAACFIETGSGSE